ncbi:uncharacterized protein LOC128718284 [Anopheles marshallii]|uniref:uncharacterized protein LOC128718284 n=1 Tax=Anopheles marshallii TaxID=1521116 RepID=UPI00237A5B41|nr:uncharacterized protein LOC128718284 [Anopheles marshallii]
MRQNQVHLDADSIDSDTEINVGDPISQTLENMSIIDGLRYWALTTNAPHSSINIVLKLFKKVQVDVPANAKTLLRTKWNTSLEIAEIGGGQLWYCGFEKCLINYFCVNKCPTNKLSWSVSIDGLPLHNSSSMQFWPILFTVQELPQAPIMTAGIFCGPTKPTNLEQYLRPKFEELNWLFTSGITIRRQHVTVKLRVIVADTLARSFIKGVVSHNSYERCLKCTVKDTYIHPYRKSDRVVRSVRRDTIMKRLLIGWRDGVLGRIRWSNKDCEDISVALGKIALPSEIHRKIRPLKSLKHWKASECATILHYAAIVMFEPYLPEDVYQHFMLLFCDITLLSSSVYKDHWPLAGRLLDRFVLEYSDIYGERYVNSNVHNVQHVYEEVQRFGSISSLSTYPYESKLHHLKRLIRSGWKSLEQAVNRLSELDEFFASRAPSMIKLPSIIRKDKITTAHVRPNFIIQDNPRNCWFLTKDENIVQFHTAKER